MLAKVHSLSLSPPAHCLLALGEFQGTQSLHRFRGKLGRGSHPAVLPPFWRSSQLSWHRRGNPQKCQAKSRGPLPAGTHLPRVWRGEVPTHGSLKNQWEGEAGVIPADAHPGIGLARAILPERGHGVSLVDIEADLQAPSLCQQPVDKATPLRKQLSSLVSQPHCLAPSLPTAPGSSCMRGKILRFCWGWGGVLLAFFRSCTHS